MLSPAPDTPSSWATTPRRAGPARSCRPVPAGARPADPAGASWTRPSRRRPLGHDNPVYLSCRNTYGRLLIEWGDYATARAVQEEVYQARTRVLGPEHADTLRAGRDLVQDLYYQGHPRQAAQQHDRLVDAFTATLGPDDLETITARAYLATILRDAGSTRGLAPSKKRWSRPGSASWAKTIPTP